ncbi:MAG: hypothetical protein ISR43_09340, partial [Acidimicrobiia bacterium]|nr:hypothetical protein [Acidimicrobiia bacterium]
SVDTAMHTSVSDLVRELVLDGMVEGVHDLSAGGLGVALAEMATRSGVGVHVARVAGHRELFGEGPSRVVVSVDPEVLTEVMDRVEAAAVPASRIGMAIGDRMIVKDLMDLSLVEVSAAFTSRLPEALGSGTTNRQPDGR